MKNKVTFFGDKGWIFLCSIVLAAISVSFIVSCGEESDPDPHLRLKDPRDDYTPTEGVVVLDYSNVLSHVNSLSATGDVLKVYLIASSRYHAYFDRRSDTEDMTPLNSGTIFKVSVEYPDNDLGYESSFGVTFKAGNNKVIYGDDIENSRVKVDSLDCVCLFMRIEYTLNRMGTEGRIVEFVDNYAFNVVPEVNSEGQYVYRVPTFPQHSALQ